MEFVFIMITNLRTLAPHGSHPDLTVLPAETRAVLQRLADMPEVSQISSFLLVHYYFRFLLL